MEWLIWAGIAFCLACAMAKPYSRASWHFVFLALVLYDEVMDIRFEKIDSALAATECRLAP